jgi:hypothetical protein
LPRKGTSAGWLSEVLTSAASGWLLRPAVWRQAAFAALLIALSVSATVFFLKRGQPVDGDLAREKVRAVPSPTLQEKASPAPQTVPPDQRDAASGQARPEKGPAQSPPAVQRSTPPARQLTEQEILSRQIARAEREYRGAIRLLDRAIAQRKSGFDPDLIKQYEESLALIDNSIAASRRAFRDRPDDLAAGQFLLTAYARKVELMQEIALR